jgi:dimethylhistidine N-methyltransferase
VRPDFFQTSPQKSGDIASELRAGIAAEAASVPAWFLYDEVGSRLFDVITVIPEYYPTRTEAAIFQEHLPAMAEATAAQAGTLIDLGAGSCDKAPQLFPFLRPRQYVPVDISVDHLRTTVTRLQREHADIEMIGVGTDFSNNLVLPDVVSKSRRVFFYPGSSIGNFTPAEAKGFIQRLKAQLLADGAVWIGIDLVKDKQILERAYDDELGVTAAFNRNLLTNVNQIAGTDFAPNSWRHVALFDETHSRIEMHLEAREAMNVRWPGGERAFAAGERIHTENSYKYTPEAFRSLLDEAGMRTVGMWTDEKQWFAFFAAVPA